MLQLVTIITISHTYEVLYAVNFGPEGQQTDSNGITYQVDNSTFSKDIAPVDIIGALDEDQRLYKSCTYGKKLTYDLPLAGNGKYLLVWKLFDFPTYVNMDLYINGIHKVLSDFSINKRVAPFTAYDEHIFFSVCDGNQFKHQTESFPVNSRKISVTLQTDQQNGDIYLSAMALLKGDVENFPKPTTNKRSRDSIISQVFQKYVHKCTAGRDDSE
jgi:Malectin domain